jgi:hypothetical protein
MAHLGPTMGGGQNIPTAAPTPIQSSGALQNLSPPPLRLPSVAVRPPASPNRRPSTVYRSDGAVS